MSFFKHYERASGQRINLRKSNLYAGKWAYTGRLERLTSIAYAELPFNYLGAPF